jgi:hypothetical protein
MSARITSAAAALAVISTSLAAAPVPTPFKPDRTAEDYSYLRHPKQRGDWADTYKYVPLNGIGSVYLSFGGELRERFESFDEPRFGCSEATYDSYLLGRALVHADLHAGEHVRVFAQLGDHRAFGKKKVLLAAPDQDRLDVQQLFVDLSPLKQATLRFGRQEMMFSPLQRFISFRDGTNVRQNFDGGRFSFTRGPLKVDAFLVRPVLLQRGSFDDNRNRDQSFGGLYASQKLGNSGALSLDGYIFELRRQKLPGGVKEKRHNIGLRFAGSARGFDWDNEAIYQFGPQGLRRIRAWAASADFGYTLAKTRWKPRLGLRFDAGSGDKGPADNRADAFYPLFPSGPYFNEANVTSWTNLVALRPNLRLQPTSKLTLIGSVQFKWRESCRDAVYLGPSTPLPATFGNRAREIGQVWTFDANYQLNRNLGVRAYYLHHSAGDAIREAGGRPIDFVMGSMTLKL